MPEVYILLLDTCCMAWHTQQYTITVGHRQVCGFVYICIWICISKKYIYIIIYI